MKIFLSHSSTDKDIVGKIHKELGSAICHYDIATFDPNGFLPEQIHESLLESTHFVLFASKAALESGWVQGEIKNAFLGWMKSGIKEVMVFLLREGTIDQIPDWLKSYVIVEHPSPAHIVCRIKGRVAAAERSAGQVPPFYRYDDLTKLEQAIVVPSQKMPKAIMLCGADGYGKKQLINELYDRHFGRVAKYKISVVLDESASEFDLYRSVIGSFTLISISELSAKLQEFEALQPDERYKLLAEEIVKSCNNHQVLLIEANDAILNERGELAPWIVGVIKALPETDYPVLSILSARKPTYIDGGVVSQIFIMQLKPLPAETSKLLFQWWLRKLEVEKIEIVMEHLLEYIEGNQKQIELAARLVKNLDIPKGLVAYKHRVFADLERQANVLLKGLIDSWRKSLILAFIGECGYVSEADLLTTLNNIDEFSEEQITLEINELISYGFVLDDGIALRLPPYLVRTARRLSEQGENKARMKEAWLKFIGIFSGIESDSEASIAILNEACIAHLRSGENKTILAENIILPSQCFRIARTYYDNNEHENALRLCKTAYSRRIALTEEAAIEVLKIQGLAAARLNNQSEFKNVIESFSEYRGSDKPKRIRAFLLGFEARLAGDFDKARLHMTEAYNAHGKGDFHVLRELAFLCWAMDDFELAASYIRQAPPIALSNLFVLETRVRIALALGDGYVKHNNEEILGMIDEIELNGSRDLTFLAKAEYELAIKRQDIAMTMITDFERAGGGKSQSVRILKVKVLLKNHRFGLARDLALKLKGEIESETKKQRQSALPIVVRFLIEAAAGVSIDDGISELQRNFKKMPLKISNKMRQEILSSAAFSKHPISSEQQAVLRQVN